MPDRVGAHMLIADRKHADPDSQTEGAKMNLIASIKPKMHVKTGILAFGLIPISVAAASSIRPTTRLLSSFSVLIIFLLLQSL